MEYLILIYAIMIAAVIFLMKRNKYVAKIQREMIDEFYSYIRVYYIPEYYSRERGLPYKKFEFEDYSYSYNYILYRMFYTRNKEQFWKKDFREDIDDFLKQSEYLEL